VVWGGQPQRDVGGSGRRVQGLRPYVCGVWAIGSGQVAKALRRPADARFSGVASWMRRARVAWPPSLRGVDVYVFWNRWCCTWGVAWLGACAGAIVHLDMDDRLVGSMARVSVAIARQPAAGFFLA
jgi:hypothetical protein